MADESEKMIREWMTIMITSIDEQ